MSLELENLLSELYVDQEGGYEGAAYLREYVVHGFPEGEAVVEAETHGDGGIEVAAGDGGADRDGDGDADAVDLEFFRYIHEG